MGVSPAMKPWLWECASPQPERECQAGQIIVRFSVIEAAFALLPPRSRSPPPSSQLTSLPPKGGKRRQAVNMKFYEPPRDHFQKIIQKMTTGKRTTRSPRVRLVATIVVALCLLAIIPDVEGKKKKKSSKAAAVSEGDQKTSQSSGKAGGGSTVGYAGNDPEEEDPKKQVAAEPRVALNFAHSFRSLVRCSGTKKVRDSVGAARESSMEAWH